MTTEAAPPRPEHRLMLEVFRAACGAMATAEIEPQPDLDWKRFLVLAAQHGMVPQAAAVLGPLAEAGQAPEAVAGILRQRHRRSSRAHLAALATARDVRQALGNLPYAVLKGPALALSLYGNQVMRLSSDVDVLVRRIDRETAISRLAAIGYAPAARRWVQGSLRRWHFHLVLEPAHQGRLKIELHWALVDRVNLFRIDHEALFSRLRTPAAGDPAVPALGLEDELLYLAVHAAKHGVFNRFGLPAGEPAEWFLGRATGNRLRWFLDLHALLEMNAGTIDWPVAGQRAVAWNVAAEVAESLSVLEGLAGDRVAADALARLDLEQIGPGVRHAGRPTGLTVALFRSGTGRRLLAHSLGVNRALVIRPARLLLLGRLLLPTPAEMRRYYGRGWLPWLYLKHPVHLARRVFWT